MSIASITRPVMKIGTKGPEVAKIQTALQHAGFSPGPIDSDFGWKTERAVRAFQNSNHLRVDGVVGRDTWTLLQHYPTTRPDTSTQGLTYQVKPGDTLFKLHQRFHVGVDEIRQANPGVDAYNLPVHKVISIPKVRGEVSPGARPGTTPGQAAGGDNAAKVWNFFKQLGFSNEATAGIMGNLQQESDMNPRRKQDYGGRGRGLAQWSVGERWETLKKFAYNRRLDPLDLYTQLRFIWWEVTEVPWFKDRFKRHAGGLDRFMKIRSIDEAVAKWEEIYELAGVKASARRKKFAYDFYRRFAR